MIPKSVFIQKMRVSGLLSFPPGAPEFDLGPLTVLIGANASGKSNLIEALGLLQAAPIDLAAPIHAGGGIAAYIWDGVPSTDRAEIEVVIGAGHVARRDTTRYGLTIGADRGRPVILDERVDGAAARADPCRPVPAECRALQGFPELALQLARIRLYRHTRDDLTPSFLGVLAAPEVRQQIVARLRDASDGFEDICEQDEDGLRRIFVKDRGRLRSLLRISDGALRWLRLLAILLDPSPPPLVVIEDPELGLHPDLLPGAGVRDLLLGASERCQIIVTTHSTALVDCFSEHPEHVRICEKDAEGTRLFSIPPALRDRLRDTGSLAQLWASGEIGGTRW